MKAFLANATLTVDIPAGAVDLRVPSEELVRRRVQMEAKGESAWTATTRQRRVPTALKAYAAHLVTSADKGAVRDISILD